MKVILSIVLIGMMSVSFADQHKATIHTKKMAKAVEKEYPLCILIEIQPEKKK